jgi:HMG (high mobility group) box
MWKNLSAEERIHWENVAAKDKQRFMVEKSSYTGPWQVPWKRARKDPSAPKRPMSAFLYFSQEKRRQIKEANPNMRNTEISRVLGELWRNASDDVKLPHVEREKQEREKYKVAIADWRTEYNQKVDDQQKQQADQVQYFSNSFYGTEQSHESSSITYPQVYPCHPYGDHLAIFGQHPNVNATYNYQPSLASPIYCKSCLDVIEK